VARLARQKSAMSRHMQCSNSTAVCRNVDWPN
jgi:hypothetical protein